MSLLNQPGLTSSLPAVGFLHVGCLLHAALPRAALSFPPPDSAISVVIYSRPSASDILIVPIFPTRPNNPH